MRVLELIREATDVSEFGEKVIREAIPKTNQELRKYFDYVLDRGKQKNPEDPAEGAYDAIEEEFPEDGQFQPYWVVRDHLVKNLSKTLMGFIEKRFGKKVKIGEYRDEQDSHKFGIELNVDPSSLSNISSAAGHYSRESNTSIGSNASVHISEEQWRDVWEQWFENYVGGGNTAQPLLQFFKPFMNTLIHEVTHMINDIMGSTQQNTAMLKRGKAFGDEPDDAMKKVVKRVGPDLLHLSRTSEIQTYASEIAWDIAGHLFTSPEYVDNPEAAIEQMDSLIEDLANGYGGSTQLYYFKDVIKAARKNLSKGEQIQVNRIWKKLLGQVSRNLNLYKKRLMSKKSK